MTNEEYREYVHTMYKENFLDKGKKPKWIQIFGDSFGHFIDEGTWPYEFSKIIGCPVVTFARSGANNTRTMSYFHQYYDEDCLNIVLFTGTNRLYIADDLFTINNNVFKAKDEIHGENTLLGEYQKLSLSENHMKNLVDSIRGYYKYLDDPYRVYIFESMLFEKIILKKNTIILKCFNYMHCPVNPSESRPTKKFFDAYWVNIPTILGKVRSLHGLQILQYTKNFERDNHIDIPEDEVLNSIKNHFSYGTQKYFAKFLSDIILFNIAEIDLNKLEVPTPEEALGPKDWASGLQASLDAFAQCDIILLEHHRKAVLFPC